jgi:hypothetical protein
MSTIVPMPVRVKPPPGRQRRDDLARLRRLGHDHAGERRAHHGVVDAVAGDAQLALGDLRVLLRPGQLGAQRVALRHRLVVLRARDELALGQVAQARGVGFGVAQPGGAAGDAGARGLELVGDQAPRRVGIDRVEHGQHLARGRLAGLPRSAPRAPCR